MIKLACDLLYLPYGGRETGDLNVDALPIGRIGCHRTQVGTDGNPREEGRGTGEHDHGKHTQPGDQQETPHLFETPACEFGDCGQHE